MIEPVLSTIICGSKGYANVDFGKVIDTNFEQVIRHNKAVPGPPYGHKTSLQVVNQHVWEAIQRNWDLAKYKKHYSEYNIQESHLIKYLKHINYLKSLNKIRFYPFNNYRLIQQIIRQHLDPNEYKDSFCGEPPIHIKVKGVLQPLHTRCGLGHVAHCISKNIKPMLVGYELEKPNQSPHLYRNKSRTTAHNYQAEIKLIVQLHHENLIDASLCLLRDNGTLMNKFQPTNIGHQLLHQVIIK